MDHDDRIALLRRHVVALSEHFEVAQVVAGRVDAETGGCTRYEYGIGSWYARYGLMRCWVVRADESERVQVREAGEED